MSHEFYVSFGATLRVMCHRVLKLSLLLQLQILFLLSSKLLTYIIIIIIKRDH